MPSATGSVGLTPYTNVVSARAAANALTNPIAQPTATI
jgi:hypothetical protein